METQTQNTTTKGNIRPTFLQRNALSVKIVLIGLLIYHFRAALIFQPMVNFLARLFLDDSNKPKQ